MRGTHLYLALWSFLSGGFTLLCAQEPPTSEFPDSCELVVTEDESQEMQQAIAADKLREQKKVDRLANAFMAMEGISSQAFEAAWKIDIDIQRQPARVVLERLFVGIGLRMGNVEVHAAALDKPVSLQLHGVSRLQAIEQICSQVDLYPDYKERPGPAGGGTFAAMAQTVGGMASGKVLGQAPGPEPTAEALPAVELRAGVRPIPLIFAGPFALEVTRLEEYPPDATGLMEISLFTGGMHPSAQAYWSDGDWRQWSRPFGMSFFGEWRDASGLDILASDGARPAIFSSAILPGDTTYVNLHNLLRDVKSVRLATEVSVPLPTKIETIRFDDLTVAPTTSGKITPITIRSVENQPAVPATGDQPAQEGSASIVVEAKCSIGSQMSCVALDAEGHALRDLGSTYDVDGYHTALRPSAEDVRMGQFRGYLQLQGVPKVLVVKVLSDVQKLTFPVELNVALKSSKEQADKLALLEFDGPCPVELKTLKIGKDHTFWVADVQLENHSNKNVWQIDAKMQHLDRDGKKLSEETAVILSIPEPQQKRYLLATPKSTRKTEVTAFDAPDEFAAVRFVLQRITFGDGTTWKAPKP